MQKRTYDGGITTTDEQQTHYPWPCVPHPPEVPCEVAQAAFRSGRKLIPQKKTPNAPAFDS